MLRKFFSRQRLFAQLIFHRLQVRGKLFRVGMIRTKCFPCDRGCLAEMIPRFRFFAGTIERTRDTAVTRNDIGMIFAENF